MNIKKLNAEDLYCLIDSLQEIDNSTTVKVEEWNCDNFLHDLPEKWNLSRFLFLNDKLIGYLICSKKENSFHIHRFVVSEKYQNKGAGSLLLNALIYSIPKGNLLTLKVKKYNKNAIQFYEKRNFKKFAEEDVNYLYKKIV